MGTRVDTRKLAAEPRVPHYLSWQLPHVHPRLRLRPLRYQNSYTLGIRNDICNEYDVKINYI